MNLRRHQRLNPLQCCGDGDYSSYCCCCCCDDGDDDDGAAGFVVADAVAAVERDGCRPAPPDSAHETTPGPAAAVPNTSDPKRRRRRRNRGRGRSRSDAIPRRRQCCHWCRAAASRQQRRWRPPPDPADAGRGCNAWARRSHQLSVGRSGRAAPGWAAAAAARGSCSPCALWRGPAHRKRIQTDSEENLIWNRINY